MANTFPHSVRVTTQAEYSPVFSSGQKIFGRHGKLLYIKSTKQHPRLGIIVSKKAAKQSVVRSRIKRIARESFRLSQKSLPNVDIVFIARYGSDSVSNEELRHCLKKMLSKLESCLAKG